MYDLAIIGAGPAGLAASVYASRYGVKNIVIGAIAGGAITETHEIGNWLGIERITGFEFAQQAAAHVQSLGAEIKSSLVKRIQKTESKNFVITLSGGEELEARTILLAMGTKHRELGITGEKDFVGKGVSYCATCDGFFYKNKIAAVIGGGDSAASAAVYLAGIAKKVYLIYRGDKLKAEDFWRETLEKSNNVSLVYNTNVAEIKGDKKVEELRLDNSYDGSEILKADGLFIEIGSDPNIDLSAELLVDKDATGHIKINADGSTTEEGVWAAGDITTGSNKFKQIVTAASEGAIAASSIKKYLSQQ